MPRLVTACCTLHVLCEVHGDGFNEDWMCEDGEVDNNAVSPHSSNAATIASAENICSALCRYFALITLSLIQHCHAHGYSSRHVFNQHNLNKIIIMFMITQWSYTIWYLAHLRAMALFSIWLVLFLFWAIPSPIAWTSTATGLDVEGPGFCFMFATNWANKAMNWSSFASSRLHFSALSIFETFFFFISRDQLWRCPLFPCRGGGVSRSRINAVFVRFSVSPVTQLHSWSLSPTVQMHSWRLFPTVQMH